MRNIKKLTPEVIKQIIAEERVKVNKFLAKKRLQENKKLLNKLKLLKKLNNTQANSINESKVIDSMKTKLIKSIKNDNKRK